MHITKKTKNIILSILLIVMTICAFAGIVILTTSTLRTFVEKYGGAKQIAVEVGKEIKDIKQEIDNYKPPKKE